MVGAEEYKRRYYIKPEDVDKWIKRGYKVYRGARGGLYVILGEKEEVEEEERTGKDERRKDERRRLPQITPLDDKERRLLEEMEGKVDEKWRMVGYWWATYRGESWGEGEDHRRRQKLLSHIYHEAGTNPGEVLHLVYLLLKDVEGDKELEERVYELGKLIGIDLTDERVLGVLRKGVVHVPKELIDFVRNVEDDIGIDGIREYLQEYEVRGEYYVTVDGLKGRIGVALFDTWKVVALDIMTDRGLKGAEYYGLLYKLAQSLGIGGIEKFSGIVDAFNMISKVKKAKPENLRLDMFGNVIPNILAEIGKASKPVESVVGKKIQSVDRLSSIYMSKILGGQYEIKTVGEGLVSHFNYLKSLGFNDDEALALAKGFEFMRHWTMQDFERYAGCIEWFVQKLVGNGRAKRPCEKWVGTGEFEVFEELLNSMTEHEFMYYREFMKRLLKEFHGTNKVVLYRGLSGVESFFVLSSAILEKPLELIGTVSSFTYDRVTAWGFTNYAVVKVEADIDKNVVGSWFVASPKYLHEEEVILEITKDIRVVDYTLVEHLSDKVYNFKHPESFKEWVDTFFGLAEALANLYEDVVDKVDVSGTVKEFDEYFAEYIKGMELEREYDEDVVYALRGIRGLLLDMGMWRTRELVEKMLKEAGKKGF